ncbi:winged helix-turn-helix domain-containing protein [Streptomyces sp. NPDC002454]|uniref:winged helix-turn-helix domain-containing protein n=1 Tax=Streptomyces sp. NPDC002490 TaxID=3154416 RepID=UPI00331D4B91
MANTRSFPTNTPRPVPTGSALPSPATTTPGHGRSGAAARRGLRAVDRDEVVDVTDFLPPGTTWLPAPQHALPTLPGHPPMIGYLVLVPADQQRLLPVPAPDQEVEEEGDELVRVDPVRRTAQVRGQDLDLTYLEFELLAHLVAHPGRVHTRDQLVTTVWGYGHVGDGRTVDVHVARLRRKLGAENRQAIQTVRRVGYKYVPPIAS